MRTADMLPIASQLDEMGFHSVEVWGGATFDVATRFLNEDPWERIRLLKKEMPRTPFQMLLRGQNLVGYRHYADDVVKAFVHCAAENGIAIFRVFDALNDERNCESAFAAIKDSGKHIQATIAYSLTGPNMGGPVYNLDYFLQKARRLEEMGADSLCIKDMAGILAPYDAFELVRGLKATIDIPVQLHTHYTSGMASMTYLKAIEAGADAVDTALAPFAMRSSQPAIEPLANALRGTPRDPAIDLQAATRIGQYLEGLAAKYRQHLDDTRMAVIDTAVLAHQIPGGMISNFISQLKEAGALERLAEVLEELPRTRADLGYPPLVTPSSQMVGIQAVQNVLFGRYQMITSQVRDYAYGLYGRPPVPMDPEVRRLALQDYERGDTPIDARPGEILEPEIENARKTLGELARNTEDILTYILFPTTGMRFLRQKYGLEKFEEPQPVEKPAVSPAPIETGEAPAGTRSYQVYVGGRRFTVAVEPNRRTRALGPARSPGQATPPTTRGMSTEAPAPETPAALSLAPGETPLLAPMPGMLIRYEVAEGDRVEVGQPVVVLEAMKMENVLKAPVAGAARHITIQPGAKVARNELLAIIVP
jgi:pyruvate carboxylase subunit B